MENDFGLISVIMAAYNAQNTITQAIESVLAQTYGQLELLVIDDCSTDNTVKIVKKFAKTDARIRLISNENNYGVSYARKHGLVESHGAWIAILDSDDTWGIDKLEKQIKWQKETNADLIFTGSAFIDTEGKNINYYLRAPTEISYKQLLRQNLISNSSALVRKGLYETYYVVGDNMHEDFAVWLRILKAGYKVCGINEPLLTYRITKSSKSGNKFRAAQMNWNTYRHIGLNVVEAVFYECCYMVNGILKYRNLK